KDKWLEREGGGRMNPGRSGAPSVGDTFDLPVLEQNGRSASQKLHDGDELIPVGPFADFAEQACKRAAGDAAGGSDGDRQLFAHDQARVDHRVNLAKVALELRLVDDFEYGDDPIAAQCCYSVLRRSPQKHITGEEWDDRFDAPALGRAAFFRGLGKVIGDRRFA